MTNKPSWEEKFDYNFKHTDKNDVGYVPVLLTEKVKDFIRSLLTQREQEIVEEIIEDIPLCRDRITKCDCRNHDVNDEIFGYLESILKGSNNNTSKSEYRCGEDRKPRWVTFNQQTGEIINDEKYAHQDENFSNICSSEYCRCKS